MLEELYQIMLVSSWFNHIMLVLSLFDQKIAGLPWRQIGSRPSRAPVKQKRRFRPFLGSGSRRPCCLTVKELPFYIPSGKHTKSY